MVVRGDLNARVGNEVIEGIVGQHGVPGRNESGKRLVVYRALMDYGLLPERMLGRLLDVKVFRGGGGGMSHHFFVEARLKLVDGWTSGAKMEGVRNVLKVSEPNNSVKAIGELFRG